MMTRNRALVPLAFKENIVQLLQPVKNPASNVWPDTSPSNGDERTPQVGRAYNFDGIGDYVDWGDEPSFELQDFVFVCWVTRNTSDSNDMIFTSQATSSTDDRSGFMVYFTNGNNIRVLTHPTQLNADWIASTGTTTFTTFTEPLKLVVIKNGTSLKVTLGGVEEINTTLSNGTINSTTTPSLKNTNIGSNLVIVSAFN
jgi:hypothetical protein